MRVQNTGWSNSTNFTSARINIVASSDNHGNLLNLPEFYSAIYENRKDIFQSASEIEEVDGKSVKVEKQESTLNLAMNAGDWFINPSKKGFETKKNKTNGEMQSVFLRFITGDIRAMANKLAPNAKFDALYTPGNHDFDGGDRQFVELSRIKGLKVVSTNTDWENSEILKEKKSKHIVDSVRYSIPDTVDKDYTHEVLVLGATIPTMDFYNPGLMKNWNFFDNSNKKDANLREKDLQETFKALRDKVEPFKKEHPNGVVVLMSHTGVDISKMIRDNVPGINEILDGHKHVKTTVSRDNNHICSLGSDNEIAKSIALIVEKNGKIERVTDTYFAEQYKDNRKENVYTKRLHSHFNLDLLPIVNLVDESKTKGSGVPELAYSEESIRRENSYLANYLTSAVKRGLRSMGNDVDAVGIQSSIIRGGIKDESNNLDLMKIFDGVSEDLSTVKVGSIKGSELIGLVVENVKQNIENPKRNTIIQWSDIQVDRSYLEELMQDIDSNGMILYTKDMEILCSPAVKIRTKKGDGETRPFVNIDPDKEYKIAIADKYLKKDDIKYPPLIRDKFVSTDKTYDGLFRQYLKDINYDIKITDKTGEKRII